MPFEVTLEAIKYVDRGVVEEAAGETLKVYKSWGSLHMYDVEHVLGGVFPQLNYKPVAAPGSWFTVNVAPDFGVSHGPSVKL